jgi:hypothetical protein
VKDCGYHAIEKYKAQIPDSDSNTLNFLCALNPAKTSFIAGNLGINSINKKCQRNGQT